MISSTCSTDIVSLSWGNGGNSITLMMAVSGAAGAIDMAFISSGAAAETLAERTGLVGEGRFVAG